MGTIVEYRLRSDIADLYEAALLEDKANPAVVTTEAPGGIDDYELELFVVWDSDNSPVAVVGVQKVLKDRMLSIIRSDGNTYEHIGFMCVYAEQVSAYLQANPHATLDTLHDEMIDEISEAFDLEPLATLSAERRSYYSRLH